MIDIDKIEAAARAAMRVQQNKSDADAAHTTYVITANPAAVLEIIGMIRERDAVLKQALEAFGEVAQWESEGDTAHPASKAIAAIKGILNE